MPELDLIGTLGLCYCAAFWAVKLSARRRAKADALRARIPPARLRLRLP